MRERVISTAVLLAAVYEWIAIHWRSWPTLTALIRPHRDVELVVFAVLVVVAGIAAWALVHLLGERGGW